MKNNSPVREEKEVDRNVAVVHNSQYLILKVSTAPRIASLLFYCNWGSCKLVLDPIWYMTPGRWLELSTLLGLVIRAA